ncbi:MAG: HD domain-containing protein [Lachnospiraceae bacterium]|jgi:predicted HD superfamily hydrolase involved in NAD metabolism|nr:HD domain-containing protein [Lachnospiraceae bacterium]
MAADSKKIKKVIKKAMDAKRFEHTLGVEYTACALAMCHNVDIEKAQMAGLLHDCAKCLSDEKKKALCVKNHMPITDIENKNPYLLHAKAGFCIARGKFHIKDRDILNAILYHTTGRPGMSELEKIIYIADYIEPGRKQAPNLKEVRHLAFQNLDAALFKILCDTLSYLEETGSEVDTMTCKTCEYYRNVMNEKEVSHDR